MGNNIVIIKTNFLNRDCNVFLFPNFTKVQEMSRSVKKIYV